MVSLKERSILLNWLRKSAYLIGYLCIIKIILSQMNEFKILSGLELVNYRYPLTDVSHLSEEEKKELLKRGMRIPKQLKSDGEFE